MSVRRKEGGCTTPSGGCNQCLVREARRAVLSGRCSGPVLHAGVKSIKVSKIRLMSDFFSNSRRRPCIWFGSAALQGHEAGRAQSGGPAEACERAGRRQRQGSTPFGAHAARAQQHLGSGEVALDRRIMERGVSSLRSGARGQQKRKQSAFAQRRIMAALVAADRGRNQACFAPYCTLLGPQGASKATARHPGTRAEQPSGWACRNSEEQTRNGVGDATNI